MINPADRNKRIEDEAKDAGMRVLLLDVVLGHGSHPDPAGDLSKVLADAKRMFQESGCYLSCVVSLCGTDQDAQNITEQRQKLEECGAIVTESSTEAAFIAGLIGTNGGGYYRAREA